MKRKIFAVILASVMALAAAFTVSAIYDSVNGPYGNGYLNAYGTSGYAGTEANEKPIAVSVSLSTNGGSDDCSYNNNTDYPYTWRSAEAYVDASETITSAFSFHSITTSTGTWSIALPHD